MTGDCEHNSPRDVLKVGGNNYTYDRTLTTVLVELNATNYRFLNYGCNGSVPIVDHFTREKDNHRYASSRPYWRPGIQVLGQPVGVGRARVGLYQPSGNLYATAKRRPCDSPSTELERTTRKNTAAFLDTCIRSLLRSLSRCLNLLRGSSQG